jgi:anthranilate phosphoribosyltransferase
MTIREAIQRVIELEDLNEEEAYSTANEIMEGKSTDAQIAALLVGLRLKGETIGEITGFVRSMREKVTKIPCDQENVVDTCGTGGDQSGTFNISTISAFVAAGADCAVAKHGNKSVSSQCGSADILTQLGVKIDISPELMGKCIAENNIGFLFAPLLHKAMKYAIGPRRELGVRTIFNILGPLTNPANAKRQLLGVFDKNLIEPLAQVLKKLGSDHVLVVHGEDGLDEISITGVTHVCELQDGEISNYQVEPENFGLQRAELEQIKGGNPEKNAKIALDILNGATGPTRDVVLMNSGAVIYVGGKAESIGKGIELAAQSIDSKKALEKLETLKKITNE